MIIKDEMVLDSAEKPKTESKKDSGIVANDRIVDGNIGVLSDDLIKETNEEEEKRLNLNKYYKKETLLWGTVSEVELQTIKGQGEIVMVTVDFNGTRIFIPHYAYFEPTYEFEYSSDMTVEEKLEIKEKAARYNIGAKVPFIIKALDERKIEEGIFAGETELVGYGSRNEAMAKLRDIYFLHENTDEPINVNVNDQAIAHVLFVAENFAVVECLGVETRIDEYNISENFVENCRDVVSVGDNLKVRIKSFEKHKEKKGGIYLRVSARLNRGSVAVSSIKVGGTYLGIVESYNKTKRIYTIKLKNNVIVSVPIGATQGHIALQVGNRVSVLIKEVRPEGYCFGVAMKI